MAPRPTRLLLLGFVAVCVIVALSVGAACSKSSAPAPDRPIFGGGAGQVGQGPIPEFANVPALAAQSTYGLSTGYVALVGQQPYMLSTTSSFTVDGTNVVTASGGGQWLRFSWGTQLQTIPAAQQQAAWFVDPGNASGCASDANATCSLSTCGTSGDGPCATKAQVLSRWGTVSPRLRQNTTLTQLSSDTTTADPGVFRPQMEAGSQFVVQGLLNATTQVCSGTLNTITARAQTSAGTTIQSTFTLTANDGGTCTIAVGQLVVNTTHAARAWVLRLVSGSNWLLSQPLVANTGANPAAASEVNTWANGDSVTIYAPTQINIADFSPTINDAFAVTDAGQDANAAGSIFDAVVFDPTVAVTASFNGQTGVGPAYIDTLTLGPYAYLVEAASQRVVALSPTDSLPLVPAGLNAWAMGGVVGGPKRSALTGTVSSTNHRATRAFYGGGVGSAKCAAVQASDISLDFDIAIEPCLAYVDINDSDLGAVLIDSSAVVHLQGTSSIVIGAASGAALVYGAGTLNLASDARVQYPSGASNAAATIKVATLTANNQTKGCSTLPSSSTITCNLTFSAAQADTSLGATSGCLGPLGGASLCNFGP